MEKRIPLIPMILIFMGGCQSENDRMWHVFQGIKYNTQGKNSS